MSLYITLKILEVSKGDINMSKNFIKICFKIELNTGLKTENSGNLFYSEKDGDKILNCELVGENLEFYIRYDYKYEQPLCLKSAAKIGDDIKINIYPYRIELYVNGVLKDEEWPCGNHYLSDVLKNNELLIKTCDVNITKYDSENNTTDYPSVISSFENAEGWKPENNVFVGDCMPYSYNGVYHVLYLKDRHHHTSKWGLGAHQWSHISSADFKKWDVHPPAVEIDDPTEGSICTGSWIFDGSVHYLYYTVRTCNHTSAHICRSVSKDGYHFEKDKNFYFTLSDKYIAENARDPKVFKDSDGLYHMILTTSFIEAEAGCLAHLTSTDLNNWKEEEKPIYIAPKGMGEPECPDYFYKDGFYYLVYSLKGKGYYLYSENPFTDWIEPNEPIIPCKSVPKAAVWNNRLIFTGFKEENGYAGTMTFLEAEVSKNGELSYKDLII